ncbi:MAG: efflux RND transporter periplasmic adaptor subunit [Rhodobacter sp.]|nr:efflux RND transporter periplasmic adaptor subunit [Rhodobacter sp.]MCY4169210.1 efflux RND transporter periplasmic adaptor subunit [Rhodobacter sp.]MCY4240694.1 efflux RND transporter periplasmic adaptor subunit [Rhodobacter sp.]
MRLFSILTALLVSAGLYMLVFEREAVKAISSQDVPTDVIGAGASPPREETAIKPVSVVAIKSSERTIPQAVAISGLTEANRQVEVRAETAGTVISEPLRKGASVEAGEILCKIDPGIRQVSLAGAEAALAEARSRLPEAEARVSEAESRLAEATLNLNAASSLAQGGFASESRVVAAEAAADAARAGVKAAQSQLKSAKAGVQTEEANVASVRKDIERLEIRAPFAGLLESDTAELGSLLQPGGHCATVIQLDPIKLVGFVVETDIDKIRTGSRAGARLATGLDIAGQVTFISRSADPRTRTFRIEATVPNPDLAIRDGQTAEIAIEAGTRRAHLVPQSALTLNDDGALGVRLVNDRLAASFFPVTVLRDSPDGVFVGGLDEVASVIVVGQEYVTDGVPVIPTYREGGQ